MPNSIVRNPIPVVIDNTQATSYTYNGVPVTMEDCTITRNLTVASGRNIVGELDAIKRKLNEIILVVNQVLNRNITPL